MINLSSISGIGKTTLVQKLCDKLANSSVPAKGFYTEEVRSGQKRIGFDIVTLDGKRGTLARIMESAPQTPARHMVGQYTVSLKSFETLACPVFQTQTGDVLVLDEIGRMELFSDSFKREVTKAFGNTGITILATIPIPKAKPMPFIENLRRRPDSVVVEVDRSNRDDLMDKVYAMLCPRQHTTL
ncbi:Cancer-related nucleoside-triphosphatase [Blattella germanica]|nr:Cancer-related nucleoside-triphosphatase [Blattella germanica]